MTVVEDLAVKLGRHFGLNPRLLLRAPAFMAAAELALAVTDADQAFQLVADGGPLVKARSPVALVIARLRRVLELGPQVRTVDGRRQRFLAGTGWVSVVEARS